MVYLRADVLEVHHLGSKRGSMGKFDINKLCEAPNHYKKTDKNRTSVNFFKNLCCLLIIFGRFLLSLVIIGGISSCLAAFCLFIHITKETENNEILDISAKKISLTSFIFVNNDENVPVEYAQLTGSETRIWASLDEIPKNMQNAIIAIEDKRFYEHHGVDFKRTIGAILNLLLNKRGHGGSTINQQLVKNLTHDNAVSFDRKAREIARARYLDQHYSKDDILEAYCNVACFCPGSRGVEAAANIYFDKSIGECTISECAAIAAVTQNPTANNPLTNPKNNLLRRNLILKEMLAQGYIDDGTYNSAISESEKLKFANNTEANGGSENSARTNAIRNWYIEAVYKDVLHDLMDKFKIGKSAAEDIMFTHGIKIYCAMDQNTQKIVENCMKNLGNIVKNKELECGFLMMDYSGRILASVGSRKPKEGNLLYDRANFARRQPGSIIKPLSTYAPAIESGLYNYSSIIPDEPLKLPDSNGDLKDWPNNWYGQYKGSVLLNWAIEKSANAPVAQILKVLTTRKSFDFLTKKLGFTSLDIVDSDSFSALATGGTHVGVTVREIAAAFQIFGNKGKFFKPYTYFYVTDRNDNVILDNRENRPTNAISPESATIMNRLLRNVIVGAEGTGKNANIDGWNIVGKTGTTNNDFDSWFAGLTPYAVSAIWTGFDKPQRITETAAAAKIWKSINIEFLKNKEKKDYNFSDNVRKLRYCRETGAIATDLCPNVSEGYYNISNLPVFCTKHPGKLENQDINYDSANQDFENQDSTGGNSANQEPESNENATESDSSMERSDEFANEENAIMNENVDNPGSETVEFEK